MERTGSSRSCPSRPCREFAPRRHPSLSRFLLDPGSSAASAPACRRASPPALTARPQRTSGDSLPRPGTLLSHPWELSTLLEEGDAPGSSAASAVGISAQMPHFMGKKASAPGGTGLPRFVQLGRLAGHAGGASFPREAGKFLARPQMGARSRKRVLTARTAPGPQSWRLSSALPFWREGNSVGVRTASEGSSASLGPRADAVSG
jgi:hypothetical protein